MYKVFRTQIVNNHYFLNSITASARWALRYIPQMWARPKRGKLFAFDYIENAIHWTRVFMDLTIWECEWKGEIVFPHKIYFAPMFWENFWLHLSVDDKNEKYSDTVPWGTVLVDDIMPIRPIKVPVNHTQEILLEMI